MEKAKIRPLATLKPFDQSWQKLISVGDNLGARWHYGDVLQK